MTVLKKFPRFKCPNGDNGRQTLSISLADVPRLLHQERPDFVALDTTAGQLAHLFVHQLLAAFASENQQPHDGVPIQTRESFRAA
jgi:hypothetical protein